MSIVKVVVCPDELLEILEVLLRRLARSPAS